jgi:hypothetical protein
MKMSTPERTRNSSPIIQHAEPNMGIKESASALNIDSDNDLTRATLDRNTNTTPGSKRPGSQYYTESTSNAFTAASEEHSPSKSTADFAAERIATADRFADSPPIDAEGLSSPGDILRSFISEKSPEPLPLESDVLFLPQNSSTPSSIENLSMPPILDNNSFDSSDALSVGNRLSDLSLIENKLLPNEDFVTQWQNAMRTGQSVTEEITIQTIFHACMKSYDTMLPSWDRILEGRDVIKDVLYRNRILLSDWGAAYAVLDGQLDQLPKEAEDVIETVLSFLTEVSTILVNSKILQNLI